MKKIAILVFDGLADWTIGLTSYELRTRAEWDVITVGLNANSIVTGGGFRILPDIEISELDPKALGLMILPGGAMWESFSSVDLVETMKRIRRNGIPIAAICGATVFLARHGFFKHTRHTSNGFGYLLDETHGYEGQEYYRDYPAISDQGIITAAGAAPEDFTYLILRELGIYSEKLLMEFCEFWHCRLEPV